MFLSLHGIFSQPDSAITSPPEFSQDVVSACVNVAESDRVVTSGTIPVAWLLNEHLGWRFCSEPSDRAESTDNPEEIRNYGRHVVVVLLRTWAVGKMG